MCANYATVNDRVISVQDILECCLREGYNLFKRSTCIKKLIWEVSTFNLPLVVSFINKLKPY